MAENDENEENGARKDFENEAEKEQQENETLPTEDDKKKNPRGKYKSKSDYISIRFTYSELEKIDTERKKLIVNRSKFIRTKYENGKIRVITIDMTFQKIHYELNKIGNNLNQIAHFINENRPNDLLGISSNLSDKLNDLKLLVDKIEACLESKK